MSPRNPNFDPAVRMVWNQCHCEDYQILSPTTIHGSKLELERLRYHENWVNAPIDAPLTSRSHNFWFDCWIFEFHTFLETRSQDISRGVKINLIRDHLKMVAKARRGYKSPQVPSKKKKQDFSGFSSLFGHSLHVFPLFKKQKKHNKNTSNPLDSSFFTKNTRYCPYTQSSSPWFYTLDLGFRGVDITL